MQEKSKAELDKEARELEIEGRSGMNKAELEDAVDDAKGPISAVSSDIAERGRKSQEERTEVRYRKNPKTGLVEKAE